MAISIGRLSGGNTPADGSDPRTFPAIWNATADTLEAGVIPTSLTSPATGQLLQYNGTNWVNVGQAEAGAIPVFADSAARSSAIPSPSEGMVTYLEDTNAVEKFDGAAFVNVATAPAILQVVRATNATNQLTTSTSFTDAGASITITPQSSTSTLQIYAYFNAAPQGAANTSHTLFFQITDSDDTALSGAESLQLLGFTSTQNPIFPVAMLGVVAAGSTSAQTFKLRFKAGSSDSGALLNASQTLQMIALEVAG